MRIKNLRSITFFVVLTVILSMATFATQNSSAYISSTSAYFTRSGNDVNIYFSIVGRGMMDEIGVSKIYLYEKSGNTWSLVYTFDSDDPTYTSDMLSFNASAKGDHVTYSGSSTKDYYALLYFYASNSNGSDTIHYYTYS